MVGRGGPEKGRPVWMRDSDDLGKSQSSGQRGGDLMTNLWHEQENKEQGIVLWVWQRPFEKGVSSQQGSIQVQGGEETLAEQLLRPAGNRSPRDCCHGQVLSATSAAFGW